MDRSVQLGCWAAVIKARARLSEIHGWFTEGFDTAHLKETKAMLEQLGAGPSAQQRR